MQLPERPAVHFAPAHGWLNDPHGLTWYDGRYHLFYQCVPDSTGWRPDCHWGHATSTDLLHWAEQPIALAPGDGDDGVWSGSLILAGADAATIFYTSARAAELERGRVRTATAVGSEWSTWRKAQGPLELGVDDRVAMVRDPFVRWDGAAWQMLVGAGLVNGTGAVLSYRSDDLMDWRADGFLAGGPDQPTAPAWTGSMWECPQLLEVDGRLVLIVSIWDDDVLLDVAYAVGSQAGRPHSQPTFRPEAWRRLTVGPGHYAAATFVDALGQPCLLTWIRGVGAAEDAPWRGAHSVPYRLTLDGDHLVARFHPAVTAGVETVWLSGSADRLLPDRPVLLEWEPTIGQELSLRTANGPDGDGLAVRLRSEPGLVVADLRDGSGPYRVPLVQNRAQILIDGPVLELATDRALLAAPVPRLRHAGVRGRPFEVS